MKKPYRVLTIAGSDSGGGAGIQTDLKTFSALGVYGMSAITAITAQNTKEIRSIYPLDSSIVKDQIICTLEDIGANAIKVGMIYNEANLEAIFESLSFYFISQTPCPIVLDPVMISKSGEPLLNTNTINALKQKLFPLATVITPNIPEAEFLSSMKINSQKEMEIAAKKLIQFGANSVLIKGGHLRGNEVHDLLLTENTSTWFSSLRVNTPNTHGTGCTLSSALASFLAMGRSLSESTEKAKHFLYNSLTDGLHFQIGHGHGPAKFFCPQKDLVPLEGNSLEPIKVNSNVLR